MGNFKARKILAVILCVAVTVTFIPQLAYAKSNVPGKVSGIRATFIRDSHLTLNWSKASGAQKYQIFEEDGTNYELIKTTSLRKYTVKDLDSETSYNFKIRAYRTVNHKRRYGSYSNVFSVKTAMGAPVITAQPENKAVASGNSVTIAITAQNTKSYQWYKDGTAITGATTRMYTISSASASDAGSYYCMVSNGSKSLKSDTAKLTLEAASGNSGGAASGGGGGSTAPDYTPKIVTQPKSQTVNSADAVNLTVEAVNGLSYQWYKDGNALSDGTSSTLSLEPAMTKDAGKYYCIVKNGNLSATSDTVTLTVNKYVVKTYNIGAPDGVTIAYNEDTAKNNVQAKIYSTGELSFEGKGNTQYFEDESPWYWYCDTNEISITSASIDAAVKPLDMSKWFEDADITTSPAIPETVTKMDGTFSGCKKLSTAPSIPQSVKSMESTFERCTSLTTMPSFTNATGVTDMDRTFSNCKALTNITNLPVNVTALASTFYNCISLKTAPAIPESQVPF